MAVAEVQEEKALHNLLDRNTLIITIKVMPTMMSGQVQSWQYV